MDSRYYKSSFNEKFTQKVAGILAAIQYDDEVNYLKELEAKQQFSPMPLVFFNNTQPANNIFQNYAESVYEESTLANDSHSENNFDEIDEITREEDVLAPVTAKRKTDVGWNKIYECFKNGTKSKVSMKSWVSRQTNAFKNDKLLPERINLLKQVDPHFFA